jgi:hypothetical protein
MKVRAFIPPGSLSPTHSDGTLLFLKELMDIMVIVIEKFSTL